MGQLNAVALRVARLAADGTTPAGASNMYVTNGLVRVTFALDYDEIPEVLKRDGQGRVCLYEPATKAIKGCTLSSVEVCDPDDIELTELLSGGVLLEDEDEDTVGYAAPGVGDTLQANGISLEVWTRRKGTDQSAFPYAKHLFPKVRLTPKERSIEQEAQNADFEGYSEENPGFGNGPANDWLADSTACWQWVKSATAPTGAAGYQATPTQT